MRSMNEYTHKNRVAAEKPTVSVVITCYNYAQYLPTCIESVLSQTFNDFEVIVVDDGSTDNTCDVLKPYLNDPRIRYVRQENSGQAKAKNNGIHHSRGRFVAFLDADDFWAPTKLERQINFFQDERVGVVYSRYRFVNEDGNILNSYKLGKYLQPREGMVTRYLVFDNFVPFSSSVVRKEVFERVGVFDETLRMGIDWDLWLRASVHFQFKYVDEYLLFYRVGHQGQMSRNVEMRHTASDHILDRFIHEHPDMISPAQKQQIMHYTFMNRGNHHRMKDELDESTKYFLRAMVVWPFSLQPFGFLMRNSFLWLTGSSYEEYHRYITTIMGDLHRYNPDERQLISHILLVPGYRYTFFMRLAGYLRKLKNPTARVGHMLARILMIRTGVRYGIDIPYNTEIDDGLYIGHHGGIVVSHETKIGRNCNINQGVTIGKTYGGKHPGTPIIGNNVYLGPGSKVIGGITIGDNVMVGANAVVTSPVPDNAVVVGVPARVVSFKGSFDYVINRV